MQDERADTAMPTAIIQDINLFNAVLFFIIYVPHSIVACADKNLQQATL